MTRRWTSAAIAVGMLALAGCGTASAASKSSAPAAAKPAPATTSTVPATTTIGPQAAELAVLARSSAAWHAAVGRLDNQLHVVASVGELHADFAQFQTLAAAAEKIVTVASWPPGPVGDADVDLTKQYANLGFATLQVGLDVGLVNRDIARVPPEMGKVTDAYTALAGAVAAS